MTDWAIPQQDKLKYTQLFNLHDRSRIGFLSGLQCKDILLQSGLPKNILAEIWNLSDIDGDGQLAREEFILAMHLTNQVKSGQNLPSELYADLIPPSYRRSCSFSKNSLLSIGSFASEKDDNKVLLKSSDDAARLSSSILNSNSFEDRRRENFEKGRAELERRRLNIIEQQIAILKERYVFSKKLLAEAKLKVDTIQSERDVRMSLISSLEAQLKTIRGQKAQLDHEELNLKSESEDLKFIHPAQFVIESEQQVINQITEKLNELLKKKETKAEELAKKNKKIDESMLQLKTLFKMANEIYENYRKKMNTAKEKQAQFVDEDKLKALQSDSVLGSPLNFDPCSKSPMTTPISLNRHQSAPHPSTDQPTTASVSLLASREDQSFLSNFSPILKLYGSTSDVSEKKLLEPVKQCKRYKALYVFEARNSDELSISPGDIIIGSQEVCEPGWLSGELNNRVGLFPEAYVEPLTEVPSIKTQYNIFESNMMDCILPQDGRHRGAGNLLASSSAAASELRYKVMYAFDARNPDELTINPGDIIIGSDSLNEPGWLSGELNGKEGLFPEAFVTRLDSSAHDKKAKIKKRTGKSIPNQANASPVTTDDKTFEQSNNIEEDLLQSSNFWEGEIQLKADFKQYIQECKFDKSKSQLAHLIEELIETESDYVEDLRLCYDAYIKPLSKSSDVTQIFIKWDDLIRVHNMSLGKLSTCKNGYKQAFEQTFEIFHELLNSLVELYIDVCSQQNQSIKKYEAKLASDIRFKQLVNECQRKIVRLIEQQVLKVQQGCMNKSRLLRNSNLPLTSFMLKPMQRITKYSLLFDRILNVIDENGPLELQDAARQLKLSAQSLCSQVNEACRLREDLEHNERKLRWAQTHIKQTRGTDQTTGDTHPSISFDHNSEEPIDGDIMQFNSKTKFLGQRQLIKAGSLMKERSSKEFVLFLFNDLLLITKVKGLPPLRVGDVFSSPRAQRAYYKLHEEPLNLEDIIMHASPSDLMQPRSLSTEQQDFDVGFSDKSTGASYILSALSHQEQIDWIKELEFRSNEARANKHQAKIITK